MKKVTVKEISSNGHDEHEFYPEDALNYIREITDKKGKWLFLDGNFQNPKQVTIEDLLASNEVLISNALVGGK